MFNLGDKRFLYLAHTAVFSIGYRLTMSCQSQRSHP